MIFSVFLSMSFFGIFTALIASNRNRSILSWFFMGFIFGPFGLLFAFFMKDGKEIEEEQNEEIVARKNRKKARKQDKVLSEDVYYYEIRPRKGIRTVKEWNKVKEVFFKLLDENYKIKKNYSDVFLLEISESAYIEMSQIKKHYEADSLELLFKIYSVRCGNIDFGNDIEVIYSEKEEITPSILNTSTMDNTEKLIKLSEMLNKGLLTEEEFKIQKKSLFD